METIIRSKLIPALTGQPPPNNEMCDLLTFPARLGGLAPISLTSTAEVDFIASMKSSKPLKAAILQQSFEYSCDIVYEQVKAKHEIRK